MSKICFLNKKTLLIVFLLMACGQKQSRAQYYWWNQKHNWDGKTHWSRYLILSAACMGPNALPVPKLKPGSFPDRCQIEIGAEAHFSEGDNTQNLDTRLFVPIAPGKAAFEVYLVPLEHYQTDTIWRDNRFARDRDCKGFSVGDVYVASYFQIIKDKPNLPDLLLSANIKTASGSNLQAARFSDTPGYFFDLSAGKKIKTKNPKIQYVQPFAMLGFYAYQTNIDNNWQNDALTYGAGIAVATQKIKCKAQVAGYYGYFGNGDRPLICRFTLTSRNQNNLKYKLSLQKGLHDFHYTSLRLAVVYSFFSEKKALKI